MDIFLHMAGLAFIPMMVCLIIRGMGDIAILIRMKQDHAEFMDSKISIS